MKKNGRIMKVPAEFREYVETQARQQQRSMTNVMRVMLKKLRGKGRGREPEWEY